MGMRPRASTMSSGGAPAPAATPRRQVARFCVTLLLFILLLAVATSTGVAQKRLHEPLARFLASADAAILGHFGQASATGTTVRFGGFEGEVGEACDGILPTCIYLSAVLAFPGGWRSKAWGVLIGVSSIFIINLIRLVTLTALGAWRPELLDQVHIYVWQALLIALSMAVWVFWVERFVRPRPETGP